MAYSRRITITIADSDHARITAFANTYGIGIASAVVLLAMRGLSVGIPGAGDSRDNAPTAPPPSDLEAAAKRLMPRAPVEKAAPATWDPARWQAERAAAQDEEPK